MTALLRKAGLKVIVEKMFVRPTVYGHPVIIILGDLIPE